MGDEDTILPHKLKDEVKQALSAKNENSSKQHFYFIFSGVVLISFLIAHN